MVNIERCAYEREGRGGYFTSSLPPPSLPVSWRQGCFCQNFSIVYWFPASSLEKLWHDGGGGGGLLNSDNRRGGNHLYICASFLVITFFFYPICFLVVAQTLAYSVLRSSLECPICGFWRNCITAYFQRKLFLAWQRRHLLEWGSLFGKCFGIGTIWKLEECRVNLEGRSYSSKLRYRYPRWLKHRAFLQKSMLLLPAWICDVRLRERKVGRKSCRQSLTICWRIF